MRWAEGYERSRTREECGPVPPRPSGVGWWTFDTFGGGMDALGLKGPGSGAWLDLVVDGGGGVAWRGWGWG